MDFDLRKGYDVLGKKPQHAIIMTTFSASQINKIILGYNEVDEHLQEMIVELVVASMELEEKKAPSYDFKNKMPILLNSPVVRNSNAVNKLASGALRLLFNVKSGLEPGHLNLLQDFFGNVTLSFSAIQEVMEHTRALRGEELAWALLLLSIQAEGRAGDRTPEERSGIHRAVEDFLFEKSEEIEGRELWKCCKRMKPFVSPPLVTKALRTGELPLHMLSEIVHDADFVPAHEECIHALLEQRKSFVDWGLLEKELPKELKWRVWVRVVRDRNEVAGEHLGSWQEGIRAWLRVDWKEGHARLLPFISEMEDEASREKAVQMLEDTSLHMSRWKRLTKRLGEKEMWDLLQQVLESAPSVVLASVWQKEWMFTEHILELYLTHPRAEVRKVLVLSSELLQEMTEYELQFYQTRVRVVLSEDRSSEIRERAANLKSLGKKVSPREEPGKLNRTFPIL